MSVAPRIYGENRRDITSNKRKHFNAAKKTSENILTVYCSVSLKRDIPIKMWKH
jgi:hypothetical protein